MKNKRTLLTGATGFVGSHLCRRLLNEGFEVDIIVRPRSSLEILESIKDSITIHIHDGSTAGMIRILKQTRPDIVFHLASLFMSDHQPEDIENIIHSNITFGVQLVEAMTAAGCYCLINTGTAWQHYNNQKYNPVCLYAATKKAYEDMLTFYTESTPLHLINLILFDTYGPNDPRRKLFSLLKDSVENKKTIAMSGGEQYIDLVYIDDVTDAFLIASKRLLEGLATGTEDYAVTSKTPRRLREIVQIYTECTGYKPDIRWGERPYRNREVMVPWNKGIIVPGWKAKIDLVEGIKEMRRMNSFNLNK